MLISDRPIGSILSNSAGLVVSGLEFWCIEGSTMDYPERSGPGFGSCNCSGQLSVGRGREVKAYSGISGGSLSL